MLWLISHFNKVGKETQTNHVTSILAVLLLLPRIRITFSPIKINAEYQKFYFSNHGNKWSRCKTRAPDTQSHILNTHCLETYELL